MSSGSNKTSPKQTKSSPTTSTNRKKREILTTENSLNPILRINRNAAAVPASASSATAMVTAASSSSTPSSPSRSSAIPIARSRKLSNGKDRHRKTSSSDSLRRAIEGQRPASPLAPSTSAASLSTISATSTRRTSNSSSHSVRPHNLDGLPVRAASPAPAIHTDVPYIPTSPTPSNNSFNSTLGSFDSLKSSLRDTLQNDDHSRGTSVPRHRKTRSVSFAVEEPSVEEALRTGVDAAIDTSKQEDPIALPSPVRTPSRSVDTEVRVVDFVTPGSASSGTPSTAASSPITSTFSSPVAKRSSYPIQHWEPVSPSSGEITEQDRASLPGPLELARSLFVGVSGVPELNKPVKKDSRDSVAGRKDRDQAIAADRGLLWMTMQTLVGLWLAVIWLVVGRILGPSKRRSE